MPACASDDWIAAFCSSNEVEPVANRNWNCSGLPAVIPAPQSVGPVPGRTQVSVPFGTTFQPCAFSSAMALAGSYGYGPPAFSSGESHCLP